MGINLGAQFLPIALATMVAYYVQSVVSQMGMDERKTKSFNELHPSSNDVHDDLQSPAGVGIYFFISALIQIYNHGFKILIRPKIKAQIDEELNHENIVLPQRTTPRKTAQKQHNKETFAQRQNKMVAVTLVNKTANNNAQCL